MNSEPAKEDKTLVLSRGDFQELLQMKKRVEKKYSVSIMLPPRDASRVSGLFVVGFSGVESNVSAAMMFCNSHVFDVKPSSLKYPKKLEPIFSSNNWIQLLEDLNDVLISNDSETQTVSVAGLYAMAVISELDRVVSSLSFRIRQGDVPQFHQSMKLVQSSNAVSKDLKKDITKAVEILPLSTALILLSWVEKYHWIMKNKKNPVNLDESVTIIEDKDESVILLDTPRKEIPLVTIDDDDDDDDGDDDNDSNDDPVNSPSTSSVTSKDQEQTQSAPNLSRVAGTSSALFVPIPEQTSKICNNGKKQKRRYYLMKPKADQMEKDRQDERQPEESGENRNGKRKAEEPVPEPPKKVPILEGSSHVSDMSHDMLSTSHDMQMMMGAPQQMANFVNPAIQVMLIAPAVRRLRPIVIDGSNVAIAHGSQKNVFSCQGIKICIDFFLNRGHHDVTAFVPQFRRRATAKNTVGQEILEELSASQRVVFTPSRIVNGRGISSYDDRFIIRLACEKQGVIVSNDNFRDLQGECLEWKIAIEKRLLMYCFVGDIFMIPDDPLGKGGPHIDDFLSFSFA